MYNLTVFAIFRSITGCQALFFRSRSNAESIKKKTRQRGWNMREDKIKEPQQNRRMAKFSYFRPGFPLMYAHGQEA